MENHTDIVARIQAGDVPAFEQLFRAYYSPLCGYANKLLRDMDEAEEQVQAVFFKIWEKRESWQIDLSVKAYLYRAVHNACLNAIKHEQVKQQHADHVKATQTEGVEDHSLEQKELKQEIRQAIDTLPEKCREVFELNRFEGLKYREVAELLGISEKTVENQMGKALKLLRQQLGHLVRVLIPFIIFFIH